MTSKLETILKEIEQNERMASTELDTVPVYSRPGVEGAKRQAEENLKELKKEYAKTLKELSICIFLEGDAQDKFASVAEAELDCFSADVDGLYKKVTAKSWPMVDQMGRFSVSNIQELIEVLRDEVRDCGVHSMPMIDVPADAVFQSEAEMCSMVKGAIRRVVSDELNLHFIESKFTKEALAAGYNTDVCCLLVKNATKEEQVGLSKLCAGTAVLTVPANPTAVNVERSIKKIVDKFIQGEETKESKEN